MMNIGSGNRSEWNFEYTASKLAEGAKEQLAFRQSRVKWWEEAKAKLMTEIRASGLEVSESVAGSANNDMNAYRNTQMLGPKVMVRADLQDKLSECHRKIQSHQQAVNEYDGWLQVLTANSESRLKLTQADWLYFFGKV